MKRNEADEMLENLFLVNDTIEASGGFDIGDDLCCFIACSGACIITQMVAAPMAVAAMDLS